MAERIFIRIAEELIQQNRTSIREVFKDHLYEMEIEDTVLELLPPEGLTEGIKKLGITDLTSKEEQYLLRVLTKPELDNNILMQELL